MEMNRLVSIAILALALLGRLDAQTSTHQRIGVEKTYAHELEGICAWTAQRDGASEAIGSLSADLGYSFRQTLDLRVSVPLLFSVIEETGVFRYGLGDTVVSSGYLVRGADWTTRYEVGVGLPSGQASKYAIRNGELATGAGTFNLFASTSLSLLRDPAVLSLDLSAGTALPEATATGSRWRSGNLQCALSLQEALNENVSWSVAFVPALAFPEWHNGAWTSRAPEWKAGLAFQLVWVSGPYTLRNGSRLDDGGGLMLTGAGGGTVRW
jgi:hypothetical protein